ncbi:SEFIR domain-containing protein [Actinokineospora inagensis]|uniref:SEFIR domain-containing protein n=1 Tax=Actinokineospora inagensis TaxID=103730 RepID=UPI00042444C9|nr:SEFIR domain-containing protein [Actinokineospora inagensis]
MPRVFLSYTHDSPEHRDEVRYFAERLVESGVDVCLDQWHLGGRQDWYVWALAEIPAADFVLVVGSPRYRIAGDGQAAAEDNRGLQAEAAILRDLLQHDRGVWTGKILPVLLPGHEPDEIPLFLQPLGADHYRVGYDAEGMEDLLRVLLGQPPYIRPELGRRPVLPARSTPRVGERGRVYNSIRGTVNGTVIQAGGDVHLG